MPDLKISIPAILCATFAIFLQVQITLFETTDYAGLRINLADLLLPFTGIFILYSLLSNKTKWPHWQKPFGILWLVALTVVMTLSLMNGYRLSGELSSWALLNKFTGWFILIAYLYAGAWLATNYAEITIRPLIKPFVFCFLLISSVSAVSIIMVGYDLLPLSLARLIIPDYYQLESMMGNRNALAFLFAVITVFITIFSARHPDIIPRWSLILFWSFFPALLCLNGSRAMWLAAVLLLIYLGITNKQIFLRFIFLPILFGSIFFVSVLHEGQRNLIFTPFVSSSKLYNHTLRDTKEEQHIHGGDNARMKIIESSLERWQQSPIIGAGIGGGVAYQQVKYGETIDVIDNSMLWILTDMGLIGLVTFLACFAAMLAALWPYFLEKKQALSPERQTFLICTFLMLLVFGLFSLVHEILYSRFLWFILGLALALPHQHQTKSSDP
ncbi:MAG: hypothetical protein DHS20C02_02360 [Micavibrio sp.]|nr:MAG: hypothetical protein DHS20C02_02360 [Micavibrio sp.]